MIKRLLPLIPLCCSSAIHAAADDDTTIFGMLMIDQLEVRDTDAGDVTGWKAQAWLGQDLRKLWLKTTGEYLEGQTDGAELQLLYSQALSPYWNVQAGWRRDHRPKPIRDWLAFGIKGLAPYMFDVDIALFVGEEGRSAARIDAEYEYRLSQHLILSPSLESNLYSLDDPERAIGAGVSDVTLGLRLRYEIHRGFAPYAGIQWTGLYNDTAEFAKAAGSDTKEALWVAGVRAWF